MVDAARFHRDISADVGKARPPKHLAGSGHMLDVDEAVVVDAVRALLEGRADQAEGRVTRQLTKEVGEVVRVKRYVCVKADNDLMLKILHNLVPGVESVDFSSKVTLAAFRHTNKLNPRVLFGVPPDNLVRPIRRTI